MTEKLFTDRGYMKIHPLYLVCVVIVSIAIIWLAFSNGYNLTTSPSLGTFLSRYEQAK